MNAKEILRLLDAANDEDLMMSRMNCHIKGLHSIVLKNESGRLTRLFLCTPNHEMWKNIDIGLVLNLGVHNHRYDLTLSAVHGEAKNIVYLQANPAYGVKTKVYRFHDKDNVVYLGNDWIREYSSIPITKVHMNRTELHTVYVNRYETASWLVEEGEEVKDSTLLYTNKEVKCSQFKYFPSAKAVREYVKNYYKEHGDVLIYPN
jgi:hypothetical protein